MKNIDEMETYLVGDESFPILQSFSLRRNVARLPLLDRYFCGKWSDELHSLDLPDPDI